MANKEQYRGVADALVAALEVAGGDAAKEEAALRAAIAGYMEIHEGGDPTESGLVEYFMEDGSVANPPALERVKGASEDDMQRWRNQLMDLAGL